MPQVIKAFLFVAFFSFGASALTLALICDRVFEYLENRQMLEQAHTRTEQLLDLNYDYDVLLSYLHQDPNVVDMAAAVIFAREPDEPNTVFPRATPAELEAAQQALEVPAGEVQPSMLMDWLERASDPKRHLQLMISGSLLIMISFLWLFAAAADSKKTEED